MKNRLTGYIKMMCCILLLIVSGCKAKKDTLTTLGYPVIHNITNGKVKRMYRSDSLSLSRASVTKEKRNDFLLEQHNGPLFKNPPNGYLTFYREDGFETRFYKAASATDTLKFDKGYYVPFQNDFKRKEKYRLPNWPKNVYNPYQIQIHQYYCGVKDKGVKGKEEIECSQAEYFHEYDFDKQQVIRERKYFGIYTEDHQDFKLKKLHYTVDWIYNESGQLIRKDYFLEDRKNTDLFTYTLDHQYETSYRYHPSEYYTYDQKGRLASVKLYDERDGDHSNPAFSEEYTYGENNRLTKKRAYKINGAAVFLEGVKLLKDLYYNDQGDVWKVEARNSDGSLYQVYLYEYEYDEQNNWIKCYQYIDRKTAVPHNILRREIAYYNNKKLR